MICERAEKLANDTIRFKALQKYGIALSENRKLTLIDRDHCPVHISVSGSRFTCLSRGTGKNTFLAFEYH